jgi:hypothetical protein
LKRSAPVTEPGKLVLVCVGALGVSLFLAKALSTPLIYSVTPR